MLKKRTLDGSELLDAWEAVGQIPVELRKVDFREALKIASRFNIYAYDAYFLECAASTRSPLLTLDRPLKRIAAGFGSRSWSRT